jgi:heme A synthase
MNLKQKAILRTASVFVAAFLGAVIFAGIINIFSSAVFITILCFIAVAYFAWLIYSINLSQLEYEEKYPRKDS